MGKKKNIKEKIHSLVELESDSHILEVVHTILKKTNLDMKLRAKLSSRALRSESNIIEGKLKSRKEIEKELKLNDES